MNLKAIVSLSLVFSYIVAGGQVNLTIQVRGLSLDTEKQRRILKVEGNKNIRCEREQMSPPPLQLNPCSISGCDQSAQTSTSST